MSLYFAYGSNMDQDQMLERCPSATLVGPAMLAEYRLAFTIFSPKRQCGCADIVPSMRSIVYGLLYELSEADLQALDDFEGHPVYYQRILVRVKTEDREVDAYSYEVAHKQNDMRPSAHYLGLLQTAAARFDFPAEYQEFLRDVQTL